MKKRLIAIILGAALGAAVILTCSGSEGNDQITGILGEVKEKAESVAGSDTAKSVVSEIKDNVKTAVESDEAKSVVSEIKDNVKAAAESDEAKSVVNEIKDNVKTVTESDEAKSVVNEIKDNVKAAADSEEVKRVVGDIKEGVSAGKESVEESAGILKSTSDINLRGDGKNYIFTYAGEDYTATYTEDNWKVIDSYKINSVSDMRIICQALIDEHQVHGRDMTSYRTADDMAYEWVQHNLAYKLIPDGEDMKKHAKDVDFDPDDQNKDFDEIYKDRTGKEFSLEDIMKKLKN